MSSYDYPAPSSPVTEKADPRLLQGRRIEFTDYKFWVQTGRHPADPELIAWVVARVLAALPQGHRTTVDLSFQTHDPLTDERGARVERLHLSADGTLMTGPSPSARTVFKDAAKLCDDKSGTVWGGRAVPTQSVPTDTAYAAGVPSVPTVPRSPSRRIYTPGLPPMKTKNWTKKVDGGPQRKR